MAYTTDGDLSPADLAGQVLEALAQPHRPASHTVSWATGALCQALIAAGQTVESPSCGDDRERYHADILRWSDRLGHEWIVRITGQSQ